MQNALVTLVFYSSVILMMIMILVRMIMVRRNPSTRTSGAINHRDAWYYIDPYDIKDKIGDIFHHLVHGTIERIFVRGLVIVERAIRHFDIRLRKGIMRLVNHIDRTKKDPEASRMANHSRIKKIYEENNSVGERVDNTKNPE